MLTFEKLFVDSKMFAHFKLLMNLEKNHEFKKFFNVQIFTVEKNRELEQIEKKGERKEKRTNKQKG